MNYAGAAGLEFGRDSPALDPNVLQHLPEDCTVLSTAAHGVSFWASVGRINVCLNNGMEQAYFIKVVSQDIGKAMIMSEFESLSAIYQVTPISVPKPMAWGSYKTRADTYFLLCKFYHLSDPETLPDTHNFASLLSTLHQKSKSPNGKFGFHLITYPGNLPQWTGWEDSWEVFFTKSMRQALDLEVERKGPSEELHALSRVLFDRVIPRLLRPLESDGRSVKPSLVHGDLWYANAGTDINTGQCLVFDPCCFYAHNEYEFGQWRPPCNKFGTEHLAAYNSLVDISHPHEDFVGRLDLYRLRFDTHVSALFTDKEDLRTQVIGVMRDLVERYG